MFIQKKNPQGIPNIGNSCYLSSLIQLIIRLPIFNYENLLENIETYDDYIIRTNHDSNYIKKYIQVFKNIFYILCHYNETNQFSNPSPIHIIKLLGEINPTFISTYEQQDTQEVLTLLLDFLNNHLKNELKTQFENDFKIHIVKIIKCLNCSHLIHSNDYCLNLSICNEDKDLINKGCKTETLDDYRCEMCNKIGNIEKTQIIMKYPNILMVYYPYYIQNISNDIGCLNKNIQMPLYKSLSENNINTINHVELIKFQLKMAVVRISSNNSMGHYYINILDECPNKWIQLNDHIIQNTNFEIDEYINIRMYIFEINK
jgi:uncharacterized UBP type Zn finger protein